MDPHFLLEIVNGEKLLPFLLEKFSILQYFGSLRFGVWNDGKEKFRNHRRVWLPLSGILRPARSQHIVWISSRGDIRIYKYAAEAPCNASG